MRRRADGCRAGRHHRRGAAEISRKDRAARGGRFLGRLVRAVPPDGAAVRGRCRPTARRALRQGRQRRRTGGKRGLRHSQHSDAGALQRRPRSRPPGRRPAGRRDCRLASAAAAGSGLHSGPVARPPGAEEGPGLVVGPGRQLAVLAAIALARHQPMIDELAAQGHMVGEGVGGLEHGVDLALGVQAFGVEACPQHPHHELLDR